MRTLFFVILCVLAAPAALRAVSCGLKAPSFQAWKACTVTGLDTCREGR